MVVRPLFAFAAAVLAAGCFAPILAKAAPSKEEVLPPMTSYRVEMAIRSRETTIEIDRTRGIDLLEEFIDRHAHDKAISEALYRLAGLYWERSQTQFLTDMDAYVDAVHLCQDQPEACPGGPPSEPKFDLKAAQSIYVRMLKAHPSFRKIDTVKYLYAFSLRDQGKTNRAQEMFWSIINGHPNSTFVPDSWMAVGDHRFYGDNQFAEAQAAYVKVLDFPHSTAFPMALFKTAWCHWKLGERELALTRFKDVLDQASAPEQGTDGRQRLADLRDEALEHLVLVLTEDESQTPKDVYDFLASIGGEKYSRKILVRLSLAYESQARYEKSSQGYRYLIQLDGDHVEAADFQLHIFSGLRGQSSAAQALSALEVLEKDYAPNTPWGATHPAAALKARVRAEQLLYDFSRGIHESAQAVETATKVADVARYGLAVQAYTDYIGRFPANPRSVELSYYAGDIFLFKLGHPGEAGDAYLQVGKSAPVGALHRDALLAAMTAYEQAITSQSKPAPSESERPVGNNHGFSHDENGFVQAAEVFSRLFPEDEEIGAVVFQVGEFFYRRNDFDAAIQRFGHVAIDHSGGESSALAGDRILECLAKAQDYDNIELWATKLKAAPAFVPSEEQERLDRIIVDSLLKQGVSLAHRGYYGRAASYFLRVASEYPKHSSAPVALNNAGASLERDHRAKAAAIIYQRLAKEYAGTPEAGEATLVVARVHENIAQYAEAARHYDALVEHYPGHNERATALYNAGVLHQALGNGDKAIVRYDRYTKEYPGRDDAVDVALRIGEVQAKSMSYKAAAISFRRFLTDHRDSNRVVEAQTRLGNALLGLKKKQEAGRHFSKAAKAGRSAKGEERLFGAEARFHQGDLVLRKFRDVILDARPRKLAGSLKKKASLLSNAKNIFLDVLSYGAPEWSTAALLRVGSSYEDFANSLREYPIPENLNETDLDAYSEQLDTFALAFEEQAIGAYKRGYAKAIELGIYNGHTRAIRTALGRLSTQEFSPIVEVGTDTILAGGGARTGRLIRTLSR